MYGYIYKTTNLINGKIYIGQKKSDHFLKESYLGSGKKLKAAIKHYGKENFKVELIEEIDCENLMDVREIYWISFYHATDDDIGYNLSNGGNVNRALSGKNHPLYHKHHSQESRQKMSKSHTGVKLSREHVQSVINSRKGYHHSESTKQKISESNSIIKKGKIWITNLIDRRLQIFPNEFEYWEALGFVKGKTLDREKWLNKQNKKTWDHHRTEEQKKHLSEINTGKKQSAETINKRVAVIKNLIWINDGANNKRVNIEKLNFYLSNGWKRGRAKFKDTSKYGKHLIGKPAHNRKIERIDNA